MLETLSSLLWGWHVLGLILAAGVHFSLSTAFFQVRCFFTWMGPLCADPGGKTEG